MKTALFVAFALLAVFAYGQIPQQIQPARYQLVAVQQESGGEVWRLDTTTGDLIRCRGMNEPHCFAWDRKFVQVR